MTQKETLALLARLRNSVLMDIGDLRAVNALDKAIAAYRRETTQGGAEKAGTPAITQEAKA